MEECQEWGVQKEATNRRREGGLEWNEVVLSDLPLDLGGGPGESNEAEGRTSGEGRWSFWSGAQETGDKSTRRID